MTKLFTLTAAALLIGTTAFAEETGPGSHFVTNWDLDSNGSVSIEEATERRGDIFTTFDANEDGKLDAEEYATFDAARAADQEAMREEMQGEGMGQGQGQGQGQGKKKKGNGQGQGMGGGMGHGNGEEQGMMRAFNDGDADGFVTREEFLAKVPDWFAKMDRDGDSAISTADFGPGN